MLRRRLLLLALCGTTVAGCTSLQTPPLPKVVQAADNRRPATKARPARGGARTDDVARTAARKPGAGPAPAEPAVATVEEDGWLAGMRRRMAQASREIAADLDFHEHEGLEAFAPDAREQVELLRGDMNGGYDITR
jgi:hypothetical protein